MKHRNLLLTLIISSLVIRLIYALKYGSVWWDTSVYIGMGKAIFTLGEIGLWEPFRPLLFPIIMGIFWKINLDPVISGKILEIIFSLGTIFLVYLLARKINENIALMSATLLSFTYTYFIFSAIPTTDIPSLFFSMLAIYLFTEKRYLLAGISSGIAFNFRFPHGLILVTILLFIFLKERKYFLECIKNSSKVVAGFFIITLPYLISNYILYKNILAPFNLAREVIIYSARFDAKIMGFYFQQTLVNNPLLIFALAGLVFYLIDFRKRKKELDIILVAAVLFTIYFNYESHKEFRYAIAFLTYYCIFAAYGIDKILDKIKSVKKEYVVLTMLLIFSIVYAVIAIKTEPYISKEVQEFNAYFQNQEKLLVYGTSPFPIVYSNIKLKRITSWEQSLQKYPENPDYIAINNCDLYCDNNDGYCLSKKQEFLKFLNKFKLEFNKTVESCNLLIYKVIKTQ